MESAHLRAEKTDLAKAEVTPICSSQHDRAGTTSQVYKVIKSLAALSVLARTCHLSLRKELFFYRVRVKDYVSQGDGVLSARTLALDVFGQAHLHKTTAFK
jgi:hypothetical protein